MKSTIIRSILLFLSIPLLNSILFGIGTLFHEVTITSISQEQYAGYQSAMLISILLTGISIISIEFLHDLVLKSHMKTSLVYLLVFAVLAFLTRDQFSFRPYEHGLTFACILSVILTRLAMIFTISSYFTNKRRSITI